ncbi:MAG TPA: ATP-binding protein [Vicinamibacterales bacterium]|nr:ATP-binding protein [Vicinamibacterales bacterium]
MVEPRVLLLSERDATDVLPADHGVGDVTTVRPGEALGPLQELRARGTPVVCVLDGGTLNLPAVLTELAARAPLVPLVIATDGERGRPGVPTRGLWRPARSAALAAAIRSAARSAAQQSRVRTTLDQINIRLRASEIDERQHHRLLLSGLYLSNILEQAADAIFVTDRRGVIAVWNRAAERLFRLSADQVLGQRVDSVDGKAGPALLALVERLSPDAAHQVAELTLSQETPREVEVSLSLVSDQDGNGIAASAIARDRTEWNALYRRLQEQTEALTASNRHKEEFLAVLSHELRTPLNAVLGWARMLQQMPHDVEHVQRAAETITRNATVQWRLVTDLLDYARITAGQFTLHRTASDLAALTRATVDSLRPEMERRRLALVEDYATGVAVLVDRDRITQVITNLLTNAMKFTPEGGQIQVGVGRAGDAAHLRVRDTGRGISPQFLPHIFDPFRQGDTSTTRADRGLGLGLAITRRIVELHGGRIAAHSEGPGTGATFVVTLSLASTPAVGDATLAEPAHL